MLCTYCFFHSLFHVLQRSTSLVTLIARQYVRPVLAALTPIPAMSPATIGTITVPLRESCLNIVYHVSSKAWILSMGPDRQILDGLCVSASLSVAWMNLTLYTFAVNMRVTLDECLFSKPNVTISSPNNQCNAPCSALSNSIQTNLLTPNLSSAYDYCADPSFVTEAENCASCYRVIPNQVYISNCEINSSSPLLATVAR